MSRTWKKKEHQKLLNDIRKTLEETTEPTPKIFEKVSNYGEWGEDYFRYNLLPDALNHLKEIGDIEIAKKKHEGGQPTHYWRLTKDD